MAYQILKTDGNTLANIPDGTISAAYSTIQLPGRNYNGYGIFIDTALVHLLENFSNENPPLNTLRGQLWWKPSSNRLSVALTDGAPGLTSSWANVVTTISDPNNPEFSGNIRAGGYIFAGANMTSTGNMRVLDTTDTISNAFSPSMQAAFLVQGGAGIGGNLVVAGNIYGNFEGNVNGNLNVTGSNNGVIFRQGAGAARAAENFSYVPVGNTGGNLTLNGNFTINSTGVAANAIFNNNTLTVTGYNTNFSTGQFAINNAPANFSGGGFSVAAGSNNVTLGTTSGTFTIAGKTVGSTTALGTGAVVITGDGNTAMTIGSNIFVNGPMLTQSSITIGNATGTANTTAILTIFGSTDASNATTSGALNVRQGGARIAANLVQGQAGQLNYALFLGQDTIDANLAYTSGDFAAASFGAVQVRNGLGVVGNINSGTNIGANSYIARNGTILLSNASNPPRITTSSSNVQIGTGTTQVLTVATNSATVTGNLTVTGNVITTDITTGSSGTAGNITGNWSLTGSSRLIATYADLAERFESDIVYEPGTVVELGGEREITAVREDASDRVFGVISNTAAYLMNGAAGNCDTHPAVALAGRVRVKVTGTVSKGDRLVSAGSGLARAAKQGEATAFNTIGRALENKATTDVNTVLASVSAKLS